MRGLATSLRRRLRRPGAGANDDLSSLVKITDEDRRYLTTLYDDTTPLPPDADRVLTSDNPRLAELRAAYDADDSAPVSSASRWRAEAVDAFLDLRYFRGETLITWHYRELPRISALKFFVLMKYVRERDRLGLLDRLTEDGGFGCWTFEYPGYGTYSRDLLESANEISFLDRELGISERPGVSILDIGAGYGRLADRLTAALPNVTDYCCVDAIAESTFLCDYYLGHRGRVPPARVVPFHRIEAELATGAFDLAVNIHSFPECTHEAIAWWVDLLRRLEVPRLLLIPNEPTELLSTEADGSRRDFAPLLAEAGYRLTTREPVFDDPAVRELVELHDHFHLYELDG